MTSDSDRHKRRAKRIKDAGLVHRKVVGHPDDFPSIHLNAENKYKKRGIELTHDYARNCYCAACNKQRNW